MAMKQVCDMCNEFIAEVICKQCAEEFCSECSEHHICFKLKLNKLKKEVFDQI